MLLNLTIDEASELIESADMIREDQVIPGHFRPCSKSPYQNGYDWLYRYEKTMAEFLESKLVSYPSDLIGQKSLLHEALSNAFCHAHHRNRLKPITVRYVLGGKGLIMQVIDGGKGFNTQKVYKQYRKKRRYLTSIGNGIRQMAKSRHYGVFYNSKGTAFQLLHLYEQKLDDLFSDRLVAATESRVEMA